MKLGVKYFATLRRAGPCKTCTLHNDILLQAPLSRQLRPFGVYVRPSNSLCDPAYAAINTLLAALRMQDKFVTSRASC
jgi:hypothetical protein